MNGLRKLKEELLNDIELDNYISKKDALKIIKELNDTLKKETKEYNYELSNGIIVGAGITGFLDGRSEIGIKEEEYPNTGIFTSIEFLQLVVTSFHEYSHSLQMNNKWEDLEKTVGYINQDLKERVHIDMCLAYASQSLYRKNYNKMTHEIQAVQYALFKSREFLIDLGIEPKNAEKLILDTHNAYLDDPKIGEKIPVQNKKFTGTRHFQDYNDIVTTAKEDLNSFKDFFLVPSDYHYDNVNKNIDVMYKLWDDVNLRKELLSENISQDNKNEKILIFFAKNIDEFVDKNIQKHFWKRIQDSFPEFIKIVQKDRDVKIPKLEPERKFGGLFS